MKFCLTLAATVLLGAISLEVHAQAQQPWLADRKYGEGIGVRVGNLELHPGIAGEVGYDSNYFLRAPSENPFRRIGSALRRRSASPHWERNARKGPNRASSFVAAPTCPTTS